MGFIDWALSKFGYTKLNKETVPAGTIEKEFDAYPAASRKMEDNINLWYSMYINHPPWESCDVRPLGLPGAIGRELSRHALTEFSVTVSGSARADFINRQMQLAVPKFGENLEMGLCLGGVALKPYLEQGKNRVLVKAYTTDFTPTRFDGTGKCIGGVFKDGPIRQGKEWFVKLEYHDFLVQEDGSTAYVVENKAFRSGQDGGIGAQIPLDAVSEWKGLEERQAIGNLDGPLFAYFKSPMANREEPNSPLGVSVYSGPVKDLIEQADKQWERIWWEFKSGERKIFSDATQISAGQLEDRLFLKGAFTSQGNLFEQFSPEYRNSALYEGFQYILKIIEFNVGLAFGTISDPQSVVEKTATAEIIGKHEQYITEGAIQKAFQSTFDDLVNAVDAICSLYRLAPAGTFKTDYNWGDGVLDDPETRRQNMAMDATLVNQGLMNDWEFRMKWYGEDEETARKMLPGMEDLTDEEQNEVE